MFLKALTLQGFKTFAQRTVFAFEPGITAVVGPNGSGKSNLADAIRWVLGEQSLRALRSKRTEDILFAGGAGRPPAGLATVALTLDNSNGWLDLPFAEVMVARRAYRSGESEYYLNQERVRAHDVADLLGRVGLGPDGFAIVGQGTIDAALSLRSVDRRALIEQAAAISHLHARLDDARSRLAQARQNLERVSDLTAELTPRLQSLERQARQARERQAVEREFQRELVRWYAHLFAAPCRERSQATGERDDAQLAAITATEALAKAQSALQEARSARRQAEAELAALAEQADSLRGQLASLDQEAALAEQRRAHLTQRSEEHRLLLTRLEQDRATEQRLIDNLSVQQATALAQLTRARADLGALEETAASWQERRRAVEEAAQAAREALSAAEARHAATLTRHRALAERRRQLERTIAEHTAQIDRTERELSGLEAVVEQQRAADEQARALVERLAAERRLAAEAVERARADVDAHVAKLASAESSLASIRARVDALRSTEESGASYHAGVRAVLRAANGHGPVHLDGIVGIVAKLIAVDARQELAIETALGSHLQDIVVQRWVDAEAAIAHLKRSGAGRATFLPLDTLRPVRRSPAPTGPGLLGVAADLVQVEPAYAVIAEFLLGRTLVVEHLALARRVLRDCAPNWQIVTLEGEVARPSGIVAGGAPTQSRGTLARSRELSAGLRELAEREAERERLLQRVIEVRRVLDQAAAREVELGRAQREADAQASRASAALSEAQRAASRAAALLAVRRDELCRATEQQAETTNELGSVAVALDQADRARCAARKDLAAASDARARLDAEAGESLAALTVTRSECATLQERLKAIEAALPLADTRRLRIDQQLLNARASLADATDAITALDREADQRARRRADLAQQASALHARVELLDRQRRETAEVEERHAAEGQRLEAEQRRAAERHRDAVRRLELAESAIATLRQQISLELGPLDEAALTDGRLRINLPSGQEFCQALETLPEPTRLQARLDSLRSRLRSLAVGEDAIAEFEATRERVSFLRDQAADLQQTIANLEAVVAETRSLMASRFSTTLATVNDHFRTHFVALFGGGTARLEADDDGGVDVIAQPPGKRSAHLSMLSGGERALTAAALLFALIETHPPPFSVLDEVDAALDESNVGRFCASLRLLSARTQFLVITHNRKTMESASAIYGLAVEHRGESRVLSLRLPP